MNTNNDLKKSGLFFITCLTVAFAFYEVSAEMELVTIKKGWSTVLIGISFCFLMSVIHYFISVYKSNLQFSIGVKQTKMNLKRIQKINLRHAKNGDYFKLKLQQWRMMTEVEKSRQIESGSWSIDTYAKEDYLIYIFRSIMRMLQNEDQYLTLSNINFWENVDLDKEHFLAENIQAAKRGVIVKRVVLIDSRVFSDEALKSNKESLRKIVMKLNNAYDRSPNAFDKMEFDFYITEEYDKISVEPVPYAIVTNDRYKDYLAILPEIPEGKRTPSVNIYFHRKIESVHFRSEFDRFKSIQSQKINKYGIRDMKKLMDKN